MAFIHKRRPWALPEAQATRPEAFYDRRAFLRRFAAVGAGAAAGLTATSLTMACGGDGNPSIIAPESEGTALPDDVAALYPAERNPAFTVDRPLTDEAVAGSYNNFYEFSTNKQAVRSLVGDFVTHPWEVRVTGLVERPRTYDLDDLVRRLPLEERVYRLRCVEAWAMVVPWTGFALKALIDDVQPLSAARYVRFLSFFNPSQAPGQRYDRQYPWPYFEGLTLAEATNELTFAATGVYGKPLPGQHGAPLRLAIPWKYGFKSIKSIVAIEFIDEQPGTFWNQVVPTEYDFSANVDPLVPHPRWSQASERLIDTGEVVPTRPYNGYGEFVADLYSP